MPTTRPPSRLWPDPVAAKVPEITVLFWVVKLLTTYMGEATSDYFGGNVVVGGLVEVGVLAVGILLQMRTRRYVAAAYWFLAMAIAIFGTGVSDTLHVAIGIPYAGTTVFWAVVLAAVFWRWHRSEGTLSIHSITTRRREAYYWITVFVTFALGTAAGDLTATSMNLGFIDSAVLFGAVMLVPLVGWWRFGMDEVLAFWFAYVLTRPLGASLADYVSKSHALSGIDFGNGPTSWTAALALAALVAYLSIRRPDIQAPTREHPAGSGSTRGIRPRRAGAGAAGVAPVRRPHRPPRP